MDFKQMKDDLNDKDRDAIGRILYDCLSFSNPDNIYKKVTEKDKTNIYTLGIKQQEIMEMIGLVNRSHICMPVTDIKIIQ